MLFQGQFRSVSTGNPLFGVKMNFEETKTVKSYFSWFMAGFGAILREEEGA